MKRQRLLTLLVIAGLSLPLAPALWADRDDDQEQMRRRPQAPPQWEEPREPRREIERAPQRVPTPAAAPKRAPAPVRVVPAPSKPKPGYVLDKRHSHNHYYPPPGYEIGVLPKVYRVIVHRNEKYYFHDGIWYRPHGPRFVVVLPPIGVIVPVLPSFYTVIWIGAIPYYYAAGVYYTWYPDYHAYVVTEPPPDEAVRASEAGTDQLYIYPKQGQNEERQAKDRYECHRWAADQTGYDPTQPGGNVAEGQYADKRADYLRAMKACLEARGYSVQ